MSVTGFARRLAWSDFTSVDDSPDPPHMADTKARFGITYGYHWLNGAYHTRNVVVTVSLVREETWAVTGATRTAALLRHEQGHYDITALGARDAERRIRAITSDDDGAIAGLKDDIEAEVQAEVDAMNIQYDDDTNHGADAQAQSRWNGRIAAARAAPAGTLASVAPGAGGSTP